MPAIRCIVLMITLVAAPGAFAEAPQREALLDAPRWLVLRNTFAPGAESQWHTHYWPRTVYAEHGGLLELTGDDGVVREVALKSGQTLARPPERHKVRNIGDTTAVLVEIEARPMQPSNFAFAGGRWYDGESFVEREIYSIDGVFSDKRPERIDEIIDLSGLFLLPPFADAHAHHFDNPAIFPVINKNYLRDGVFYGVSMTNFINGRKQLASQVARRETIDVAYADVGITATFGHPAMVYESLARNDFSFDKTAVERALEPKAKNAAYVLIDNEQDIAMRLPQVLASTPDLAKIYLMHSEQFSERRDKRDTYGDRGLDPALVPRIVERLHAANLRVAAHVETANDFRVAVAARVDIIAHLPGYSPDKEISLDRYRLSEEHAARAAAQGTVVVPVPLASATSRYAKTDQAFLQQVRRIHAHNVGVLARAGVTLAIGSDTYFSTPVAEVFLLRDLGILSDRELLEAWTVAAAQVAFPDRKIGQIAPGFEASFIGLRADPLADFGAVKDIAYRFKHGQPVTME